VRSNLLGLRKKIGGGGGRVGGGGERQKSLRKGRGRLLGDSAGGKNWGGGGGAFLGAGDAAERRCRGVKIRVQPSGGSVA